MSTAEPNNANDGQSRLTVGLGQTATAINTEIMAIGRAHNRLSLYPEEQATAIATHYAAHYELSRELLKLLEARKCVSNSGDRKVLSDTIDYLVNEFKKNHKHDFGIELEWPNG